MAGKEIMVMTQADRDLIQRFLDEKRRSPVNPVGRGREGVTEHEEWLTPEVYIAKIADVETGIPALVGSGGDADAVGFEGDEPGYADCTIYRILAESGTPKLRRVSSLPRRVYNIFPDAITDTPWIPVTRDKFGSWLAMGSVGAVGTGTDANEPPCGYLILDCPDEISSPCCGSGTIPAVLFATISFTGGVSHSVELTYTLTPEIASHDTPSWEGTLTCYGSTWIVNLECNGGHFNVTFSCDGVLHNYDVVLDSCEPFLAHVDYVDGNNPFFDCCGTGTIIGFSLDTVFSE